MRKLAAVLALFASLSLPSLALAQFSVDGSGLKETGSQAYGYSVDSDALDLGTFIGYYIIRPVIGLTGLIFLVLTVYAGVMWMTSAGDSKAIEKAKGILVASVTGLVIIVSAYVIVDTVISALTPAQELSQTQQ